MEIIGLAALMAIIAKVIDFAKALTNADWNAALTQLSVWVSAAIVALLAREAPPFDAIGVNGILFGDLSLAAIALFALGLGSTASVVVDLRKAIDQTDSAATPPLLPGRSTETVIVTETG